MTDETLAKVAGLLASDLDSCEMTGLDQLTCLAAVALAVARTAASAAPGESPMHAQSRVQTVALFFITQFSAMVTRSLDQ